MKKHTALNRLIGAAFALAVLVALLWWMSAAPRAIRAAPEAGPATTQRASPLPQAGTVITVCASGCDYGNIQDAVDAASSGAEIKIAEGVYTDAHTAAETPLVYITQSLTLRGGYSVADWNTSDPTNHPTTLDALGHGRVVRIDQGTVTLENLRVTGGYAEYGGGGIIGSWSPDVDLDITISDCVVISNTAYSGGGLEVGRNAHIIGSTIAFNTAAVCGGFSYWGDKYTASSSEVISNTFMSNVATLGGGGGLCLDGWGTLSANVIVSNTAADAGGGLSLGAGVDVTVSANTIRYNTAQRGGGVCGWSAPTLSANIIADNAAQLGGGVYLVVDSYPYEPGAQLDNNFIVANTATESGSAIYMSGHNLTLRHNTLARNSGGDGSGIYIADHYDSRPRVVMTNNILVGHTIGISVAVNSTAQLEGTLWGSGTWANQTDWIGPGTITTGTVNVHADPAFVDAAAGNYHILPSSAAMNAGVDAGLYVDADGQIRPMRNGYDIGADEVPGPSLQVINTVYPTTVNGGQTITYMVVVTAAGVGASDNLILTDTLPAQQQATSVACDRGDCALGAGWGASSVCDLGTLNLGAVAHVTLTAQVTDVLLPRLPLLMRNTIFVRGDQTSASAYRDVALHNCHVWLNDGPGEWSTVQAGVDASTQATDVVKVAGVCTDLDPSVIWNKRQMVYITRSLTLRGGYSVADWNTSDPINYPTTLDALGQGRVIKIDGGNVSVENLRVTGGYAEYDGGGILAWTATTATTTISNCVVISNTAYQGGGLAVSGNANIVGSTVALNTAVGCGGLDLWGLGQVISNTFVSNVATQSGGGGLCLGRLGTLSANVIVSNTAAWGGGGLMLSGNVTASANTIRYNTGSIGGGVWAEDAPSLSANMIADNAAQFGGGLFLGNIYLDKPGTQLDNNFIFANTAAKSGSAIYMSGPYFTLRHNTLARNSGGDGNGIHIAAGAPWSTVEMINNILVSHTIGIVVPAGSAAHLEGTLWGAGAWANQTDWISWGTITTGTVNVHNDPAFVDPAAGNYHISKRSAARDAGVYSGLTVDADGDPRPYGPAYDIGADEYGWNHAPYAPRNPTPRDGAVSQPLAPTLSWQGGDPDHDPVTYTVAFGPSNPPPEVTMTRLTSFMPTGLISGTTYYWAITATDGLSVTTGSLWSFTTGKEFFYLPLIFKAASQ